MGNKNNIIDLKKFKHSRKATEKSATQDSLKSTTTGASKVIDFNQRRQEELETERRAVTRTVLSQFIGVFVVLPDKGLQPVVIHDVSEGGLAFDLPQESGQFSITDLVTMRIYLSHDTYFSFSVKVANARITSAEGTVRHGAVFRKEEVSFKTLFYFTKFLESVSLIAKKDTGERVLGRVD